ncbi:MAG: chemotaxis protein CheW [Planctomycetota bacterium]|jgi:purine-binding chemotaxis protein CheW|nr:chemotaxis protein CheW [Planctomycetota bacterium]MDA1202470.1 chemotaxis protein CheW [Planctomycetota bacterium]
MSKPHADHASLEQPRASAAGGKYLTFMLAAEAYGVPVLAVREIIRLCPITPVATMPPHVRGVINLRGRVIPLIDLRVRLGLPPEPDHDRTCIIVAQVATPDGGSRPYAVVVDSVDEVASLTAADIAAPPDFGAAVDTRFITGMARRESGVTTLLDLDAVATSDQLPESSADAPPDPSRAPGDQP